VSIMATMAPSSTARPTSVLSGRQRLGMLAMVLVVVLFGVVVELRSAFMKRRMTDVGCYLRAAWAVRMGTDPYVVRDDSGWHYNYPPLLAILMAPLADPPAGESHVNMVPYAISVAVWYVFSVICLVLGVHWLAGALEETAGSPEIRNQPV